MSIRTQIVTPLGEMTALADVHHLIRLFFTDHPALDRQGVPDASPVTDQIRAELTAYFAGDLRSFKTPVAGQGSAFARAVWHAVQSIPYGETRSYGEVAAAIGRPKAARAVARALAANPILLIVPCHRVIGADGSLSGYSGGAERKCKLLALESSVR